MLVAGGQREAEDAEPRSKMERSTDTSSHQRERAKPRQSCYAGCVIRTAVSQNRPSKVMSPSYRGVNVTHPIDDARRLIESRLAEIEAEAGRLERALASLGEGSRPRRGRPGRQSGAAAAQTSAAPQPRRTPAPRRGRTKRAARGQRQEELLAAIKSDPAARPSELAASIGIRATQVHALIAKARADRLLVRSGRGYALKA
jgi:hypothetical protein